MLRKLPAKVLACTDQRDDYSSSESKDSDLDEAGVNDRSGFNMVMPTKRGREKGFHQQNEIFSSAQVTLRYPNGTTMLLLHYVHHAVRKRALEMGFQIWLLGFVPKINLAGNCDLDQTWVGTGVCYPPSG